MSEKPITQRIKDRLAAYTAMLRDIDNQLERLDRMEMTMASPPGPDLTGMPRGSGTPSDRTGMMVERKMELEEQIDRLKAEEKKERNAIEGLILQLSDPDERAVIRLRYFDRADWESTCGVLFGDRRDYIDRVDAYTIGVDAGKATIMANLKVQEPGPKYCHFNRHPDAGYDLNFFNGLLSEKLVLTHTRRGDRWAWEKLPGHNRNEALDCRDYANAGLKIINPDMDAIERRLQGLEEKPKAPQQRRQRQRHNRADAFDDW